MAGWVLAPVVLQYPSKDLLTILWLVVVLLVLALLLLLLLLLPTPPQSLRQRLPLLHHHVMPILPLTPPQSPLFLHSACILVDDEDDVAAVHSRYCRCYRPSPPPLTPRRPLPFLYSPTAAACLAELVMIIILNVVVGVGVRTRTKNGASCCCYCCGGVYMCAP